MKRILAIAAALMLLLTMVPLSAAAKKVTVSVDGLDSTRSAGKLVVYTDNYGATTGTNYWGAEAIVDRDHRVTNILNGNTDIPEGGFVVSGHDNEEEGGKLMKTWIRENIAIGDYVYFDRRTMTLTVSDQLLDIDLSPFFSFDHNADGVNRSRNEDEMILFTPQHGATTGTNEYGYEIVVEDGVITTLGGNNSPIPKNGFVLSLHGSTAKWVRAKVVAGMTAEYDPETLEVVFTYSADGLRKAFDYAVSEAEADIAAAKEAFVYADYDTAEATLISIRAAFDKANTDYAADKDDAAFADECDRLIEQTQTISKALCESYTVQYRGVWLRPTQKTAKAVEDYVKTLHDAGINLVCVEGWFENGVIMQVPEDSLLKRHPAFNYDVLQAYIDACHKYDMECHLWMPIMCVGSSIDSGYNERTVTGQRPEWLSLNAKGQPYNKDGFMMIDPANDEAKAYMLSFYEYLVTTYDIDGFEMDYIRYYAATDEDDFGYTDAAFEGFEAAYGYGVTPKYDKGATYWKDWCQYRRDCITTWVREIRAMIDRAAPDVLLTADVAFPFEHALDKVYQNFPQWLEEGLIDVLHPMAYGDGYGEEIKQAVSLGGERCMVVTGLGAQTDILGAEELERQAREDNLYGAYGDCYFEATTYLSDQVPAAVMQTAYRNDALAPFLDVNASVAALLDYMTARIDNVILPLGGMSDAEATAVKSAIDAAKADVQNGCIGEAALTELREAIDTLGNANAAAALKSDLSRAERIGKVTGRELTASIDNGGDSGNGGQDDSTVLVIVLIAVGTLAIAAVAVMILVLRKKPTKD